MQISTPEFRPMPDTARLATYAILAATATLLAAVSLLWNTGVPVLATGLLFLGVAGLLYGIPLRIAVLIFLCLLPFDFQREVAGQWLYLDLAGILLLVPLLRQGLPPYRMWIWTPYFLFFVVTTLPRILKPEWFVGYCARWISGLIFCSAVAVAGIGEQAIVWLGRTMIPVAVYAVYQVASGELGSFFLFLNPHMVNTALWTRRASAFFWQPNNCGGFCGIVLVCLMALILAGSRRKYHLWILAGFAATGVVLSGSRGAVIATLCGIGLLLLERRQFRWIAILACTVGVVFGVMQVQESAPLGRLSEVDDFTVESRLAIDGLAGLTFLSHPLWGIGATNFSQVMPTLIFWPWDPIPAHNIYLQQLAENGILGFALFWVPVVMLFRFAWKQRADPVMLACAASFVVFAVHGLFDYMLEASPQYLLLIFCIAGLVLSRKYGTSLPSPE